MDGIISDIKRFAVHDGDGIRTTVFLKGCPLRCLWCHNPEGLEFPPEMAYYENQCVSCGACTEACPTGAQSILEGKHRFDRSRCIACGACSEECLSGAMKHYGKTVTPAALLEELLRDRDFYTSSGGGITLSGGECLMQWEFCREVLRLCKENGLNTAVDTCGYVRREALEAVAPFTDTFLYDIKAYDRAVHIRCTGKPNDIILENLRYLDSLGKGIEVRIPYVPGCNDGEMEQIAEFLAGLSHPVRVRLLPYHNYAGGKYAALGIRHALPGRIPEEAEMDAARAIFQKSLSKENIV